MRGREKVVVGSVLLLAASGSGALAGFAAGIPGGAVGRAAGAGPGAAIAAGLVLGAAMLDVFVAAPSVGRQVPRAWGRLFAPATAALLYGVRLGVGPLTILATWLWWAAWTAGALAGPLWSAGVGVTFGATRVVAMLVAGVRAGSWARLRRRVGVGVGAVMVVLAAGAAASAVEPQPDGRAASGPPAATPATATTSPASTTTPAVAAATPGVPGLLPTEVPGFERVPDDPSARLGPLDLAAAAAAEIDGEAERSLLRTRRFASGHARAWRSPEGVTAYAAVYRFASADDAALYLEDGLVALAGRGVDARPSGRVSGAMAFTQADADGRGSIVSHGLVLARGRHFVLILASGRSGASPDVTLTLADLVLPHLP